MRLGSRSAAAPGGDAWSADQLRALTTYMRCLRHSGDISRATAVFAQASLEPRVAHAPGVNAQAALTVAQQGHVDVAVSLLRRVLNNIESPPPRSHANSAGSEPASLDAEHCGSVAHTTHDLLAAVSAVRAADLQQCTTCVERALTRLSETHSGCVPGTCVDTWGCCRGDACVRYSWCGGVGVMGGAVMPTTTTTAVVIQSPKW